MYLFFNFKSKNTYKNLKNLANNSAFFSLMFSFTATEILVREFYFRFKTYHFTRRKYISLIRLLYVKYFRNINITQPEMKRKF